MKKRILAVLLAAMMLMSMLMTSASAATAESLNVSVDAVSAKTRADRLAVVLEEVVDSWSSDREISTIKEISDFAGNTYTLVECLPTGYVIYNNEAALVLERAENSPSPYLDKSGDLYYAGPTQYYYYNVAEGTYIHSVLGSTMSSSEVEYRSIVCQQAQVELNKETDTARQQYIETGSQPLSANTLSSNTYKYVGDHKDFFESLKTKEEIGYWSTGNGVCGYVASGLVLLYYNKYENNNIIDSKYLASSGEAFNGGDLTKYLYNTIGSSLGYGTSLNATQVANVMKTYLNGRGISVTTWSANMPSKAAVVTQLKAGRPVVYVDRWNDPSTNGSSTTDHDIVIYGYDDDNNLIAHFGWAGYSHVEASSPALALFISSACSISAFN